MAYLVGHKTAAGAKQYANYLEQSIRNAGNTGEVPRSRRVVGSGVSVSSEKEIQFACEYASENEEGVKGHYIHVYSTIKVLNMQKYAGICHYGVSNYNVKEEYIPIDDTFREKDKSYYVLVVLQWDFDIMAHKVFLKLCSNYRSVHGLNECVRLASFIPKFEEKEGKLEISGYGVTQLRSSQEDIYFFVVERYSGSQVITDFATFARNPLLRFSSYFYDDSENTVMVYMNDKTKWGGYVTYDNQFGYEKQILIDYPVMDFEVLKNNTRDSRIWMVPVPDQTFNVAVSVKTADSIIYDSNFFSYLMDFDATIVSLGFDYSSLLNEYFTNSIHFGHFSTIYNMFNVSFTFSTEEVDYTERGNTYHKIILRATGLQVTYGLDTKRDYAGFIQESWSVPKKVFPLQEGDIYLYAKWNFDEDKPEVGYLTDISSVDPLTTWVKRLATVEKAHEHWSIVQNYDRDFNIYGRWV